MTDLNILNTHALSATSLKQFSLFSVKFGFEF